MKRAQAIKNVTDEIGTKPQFLKGFSEILFASFGGSSTGPQARDMSFAEYCAVVGLGYLNIIPCGNNWSVDLSQWKIPASMFFEFCEIRAKDDVNNVSIDESDVQDGVNGSGDWSFYAYIQRGKIRHRVKLEMTIEQMESLRVDWVLR